jgi:hypothetical protein
VQLVAQKAAWKCARPDVGRQKGSLKEQIWTEVQVKNTGRLKKGRFLDNSREY